MREKKDKKLGLIVLSIVAVLAIAAAGYLFWQNQELKNPQKVQEQAKAQAKKDATDLVSKVKKLIDVPADETPVIATVDDQNKLKDQAFFKNVQNGDKLIMYAKAKKAIIYREKDNKLINVGPISIQNKQEGTTPQATTPQTPPKTNP